MPVSCHIMMVVKMTREAGTMGSWTVGPEDFREMTSIGAEICKFGMGKKAADKSANTQKTK